MGLLSYSYPPRTKPSQVGRARARHSTPTCGTTVSLIWMGKMMIGAGCVGGWIPEGHPPLGGGMFSCVEMRVTGGMYALQLTHVTSRLVFTSSESFHDEPRTTCCGKNESMVSVCRPRPTVVRS